jgi:hypothetical protein
MKLKISFSAVGWVQQTIEITDPNITPMELVTGLNSGKFVTTIQKNGSVDITDSGKSVGKVINVDNSLEYSDFELDE